MDGKTSRGGGIFRFFGGKDDGEDGSDSFVSLEIGPSLLLLLILSPLVVLVLLLSSGSISDSVRFGCWPLRLPLRLF